LEKNQDRLSVFINKCINMPRETLIACHECDLLYALHPLPTGIKAKCERCGAILYQNKSNSLDRTLALAIAGLVLFFLANTFPFLAFQMKGQATETNLLTGIVELYKTDMEVLAALVFFTTMLVPLIRLLGLVYILLSLRLNHSPLYLRRFFRFQQSLQPWSMIEVFMLGILVAVVKLDQMASIVPGIGLWSFAALIFVLAAAAASLDPRLVWERQGMDL
jgi:paraquat-inducible protein A